MGSSVIDDEHYTGSIQSTALKRVLFMKFQFKVLQAGHGIHHATRINPDVSNKHSIMPD